LPQFVREHDVYRIRVDPASPVHDLHPVTLANLRRMQEQLQDFYEIPEATAVRLAEMTADRDRLWEELQEQCREDEATRAALGRAQDAARELEETRRVLVDARERLQAAEDEIRVATADRDRLQLDAARRGRQVHWLSTELDRVRRSRSVRLAQRIATLPPTRAARRVFWVVKDVLRPAVRVRATGRGAPESAGNEVWVLDGSEMRTVTADGHWRRAVAPSGVEAWRADGEGTLVLSAVPGAGLRLRSHPGGGIAEIRFGGRLHCLDLHTADEAVIEMDPATGRLARAANGGQRPDVSAAARSATVADGALERVRWSGRDHLAITPPDWLGIGASMEVLFGQVLHVPELHETAQVRAYAELLLSSGVSKIVLGGFARGYDELVVALKKQRAGLRIYGTWHGSAAQHSEAYVRWGFNTLHTLAEAGVITCIGHTKVGLEQSLRHVRYPIKTLLNWYPVADEPLPTPAEDGQLHLSMFSAGSGWRKNVHNQITAAALIEDHALHVRVTYPDELEWARIVRANLAEVFGEPLPRERLHRVLGRMHCNLYVTFAENIPMFPLESLALGVVTVVGPGGFLFRDHAFLRERLLVPHPDDPVVIAAYVRRAVEERAAILSAYREFCREYIPRAQRTVEEFLAVD
jgi:hypothetical protein